MKQFSLEEYLKDPSRKVITRDGRDVRIICTDRKGDCPIIALIKRRDGKSEFVVAYSKDGITEYARALFDLFFAPEKKEGWINIYYNNGKPSVRVAGSLTIYSSEKDAKDAKDAIGGNNNYITTIKIEWEE